jgi:hypothetical protein
MGVRREEVLGEEEAVVVEEGAVVEVEEAEEVEVSISCLEMLLTWGV